MKPPKRETIFMVLARGAVVDKQGDSFSREALESIAIKEPPPMISHNFDPSSRPVGLVKRTFMEGDNLMAEMDVDVDFLDMVFRPGGAVKAAHYEMRDGKRVQVIDRFELFDVSAIPKENDVYEESP
jgi:hypothetical protein